MLIGFFFVSRFVSDINFKLFSFVLIKFVQGMDRKPAALVLFGSLIGYWPSLAKRNHKSKKSNGISGAGVLFNGCAKKNVSSVE